MKNFYVLFTTKQKFLRRHLLRYSVGFIGVSSLSVLANSCSPKSISKQKENLTKIIVAKNSLSEKALKFLKDCGSEVSPSSISQISINFIEEFVKEPSMQAIMNKKDFLTAKKICTFKDGTKVKFFANPAKVKHIFLADSNEKMIFGGFLYRDNSDLLPQRQNYFTDKLNRAIRVQGPEINLDNPGEKHLQSCRQKMTIPEEFNRTIAMELGNLVRIVYNDFDNNQKYPLYLKEGDTILTNRTDMTTKAISQYSINPSEDSNKSEYRYTVSKILEAKEIHEKKRFCFILERKSEENNNNEPIYFFVFRGTIQPYEWLQDAKFELVEPSFKINGKGNDSIKVSKGFNDIYASMSNLVDNFLDDLAKKGDKKDKKIYVTGHSLGAAIATLSTLHIAENHFAPTLYAFASPRVGNLEFAKRFSDTEIYSQTFRIANCEDLVNSLPTGTITEWNGPEAVGKKAPDSNSLIGSIEKIAILLPIFTRQAYEHVGQPCYFSHQTGFISSNHNMSVTYCSAIFGGELPLKVPKIWQSPKDKQC